MEDGITTVVDQSLGTCVTAVACAAADNGRVCIYAGTAAGIAWSLDMGETWVTPPMSGEIPALVTSISTSPRFAQDRTVYVGTMDGCFRSSDGGSSFERILSGGVVQCLVVIQVGDDPDTDLVVIAGTLADGIIRSGDGGDSWQGANVGLLDLGVLDISCSPGEAPDRTVLLASGSGLYRSRNSGRAWRHLGSCPIVESQCAACSVDGSVYVGTDDDGLYSSMDGGESWLDGKSLEGSSINAIDASSPDPAEVIAATERGVWFSSDRGRTWRCSGADLGAIISLAALRLPGMTLIVAGTWDQGVHLTLDNGQLWQAMAPLPRISR